MSNSGLPLILRKFLAFGTGVGIEVGPTDLTVSVVRSRPSGSELLGSTVIAGFRERPAVEWGREYADFVKKFSAGHLAAVVIVPRSEVIVRTLQFPAVGDEELEAAIGFQLDTLHPYAEDDAVPAFARLSGTQVLIGVLRRQKFEAYQTKFTEAGIKVVSFTFSAAAIYSAIRMTADAPKEFLATQETVDGLEVYGESLARPVFSSIFDLPPARAVALAAAELRLPSDTVPQELGARMAQAAALCSAAPALALGANFLPEGQRRSSSKWRYVPTAALATVLLALLVAIGFHEPYDTGRYVAALQAEIKRGEPIAARVPRLDKSTEQTRARVQLLDDFRRRTRQDLDLLLELTSALPAPTFLSGMDMTRESVNITGETDQAAPLLRVVDNSPRLANSEFTMPIGRVANGEVFRIRSQRETPPAGAPAAPVAPVPVAVAPAAPVVAPPAAAPAPAPSGSRGRR
jgi:Tfp pilus assembly protein PilN